MAEQCPLCKDSRIYPGSLVPNNTDGDPNHPAGFGVCFIPRHVNTQRLKYGVHLVNAAKACLSCGHIWTYVEPEKLRDFVRTYGNETAKQHYAELGFEPRRSTSLQNVPEDIRKKVLEIDSLALSLRTAEVTRRYRELAVCDWDTAVNVTRAWVNMTMSEKLAAFGWYGKQKPVAVWTDMQHHPLSDRELDG